MQFSGKTIRDIYKIQHLISEDVIYYIFQGQDILNDRRISIQIIKNDRISHRAEDIIRFNSELQTILKAKHPQILNISDFGETQPGELSEQTAHYIISEPVDAKNLSDILSSGKMLTIEDALYITIQICQALTHIHNYGVVHRELRPANIMFTENNVFPKFNSPKLANFGISHIREYNAIKVPEEITSIFSYMSPEQTGMVKRVIDERSDLYALGIVLYQLLTGSVPFLGSNVATIFHQHVAKIPQSLRELNPKIPETLEKIVFKLLDKEPEKRYQSAAGLQLDLKKIHEGKTGFILGLEDASIKLSYRTRMIGRTNQLDALKRMFTYAQKGRGRICLIKGDAGSGKSRLAEELRDYIYLKNGQVIHGKTYTGESKIPYGPFKEALDIYLQKFSGYPKTKQLEIQTQIKSAIGNLGKIILSLNPKMTRILGPCPPLVELAPERENARFLMTVSRFFRHLARIENGLTVTIDDLQWCDDGSLDILQEILHDINATHLLMIGTYRDKEIADDHHLARLIQTAENKQLPITEIRIDSFTQEDMHHFIAGLFHEPMLKVIQISNFLFTKSRGNPFFTIELLKQLIDEKAIFYQSNQWHMNLDMLKQTDIATTIIDILLKRITWLSEHENTILSYAAIIGRNFHIDLLFDLMSDQKETVVAVIDHAKQLQLIEEDLSEKGVILFVHERIKEAFYQNNSAQNRKKVHLKIATAIERINAANLKPVLFDLAYHFIESGHIEKIIEYAFSAGVAAKKNYGNEEALRYFAIVLKHLSDVPDMRDTRTHELWLACKEHMNDIYFTIGNNDQVIAICGELLQHKTDPIEIAFMYKQLCHIYYRKGDYKNCEEYGRKGLALLGYRLPNRKNQVIAALIKEFLIRLIHIVLPPFLFLKAPNPEAKHKLISQFIVPLTWLYIFSDKLKFVLITLFGVNFSKRNFGISKNIAIAFCGYGGLLMALAMFKKSEKYYSKALHIQETLGNEWGMGQAYQGLGYGYDWSGQFKKSLQYHHLALEKFEKIGDATEIGMTLNGIAYSHHSLANLSELRQTNEQFKRIANKSGDIWQICIGRVYNAYLYNYAGEPHKATEELVKAYDLSLIHKMWYPHCIINLTLGCNYIFRSMPETAIPYLEKARQLQQTHQFLRQYVSQIYIYLAEAYIDDYGKQKYLSPADKKRYLKKIKAACAEARRKTRAWITHHGIALRVTAQYYALTGNYRKAEYYFLKSIQALNRLGRKLELGISLYVYGRFLSQNDNTVKAKDTFTSAYKLFKEVDCTLFLNRVTAQLGIDDTSTAMDRLTDRQRLSSIMNVSQDISSILNPDELLDQVMDNAIEVTGAQRGYIFIADEKTNSLLLKTSKSIIDAEEKCYSKQIVDRVFSEDLTVHIANASSQEIQNQYPDTIDLDLKSILAIPLKHHDHIIGVCYLDNPLSTGVFSNEDIEILKVLTTQSAISIENASLYANLEDKVQERTQELNKAMTELTSTNQELLTTRDALWGEMQLAKKIQTTLLPRKPAIVGYDVTGFMQTADAVGGDYYDIIPAGNIDWIVIGDVSGHGVASGLVMMMTQTAIHTVVRSFPDLPPSRLVEKVNAVITQNIRLLAEQKYMTLMVMATKRNSGVFRFAGMHQDILVYRQQSNSVETVRVDGMWVGMLDDISDMNHNASLSLESNDVLLLFTDGVTESTLKNTNDKKRHMFGIEKLTDILLKHGKQPTITIKDRIFETLSDYHCDDDVTLVLIKRL